MSKRVYSFIAGLMVVSAAFGTEEYRIFMGRDGIGVEAKIIQYDAAKETVYLEKKDSRKHVNMSIGLFSDLDQNYIKEWPLIEAFMSKASLKLSAEKKKYTENVVFDTIYKTITEESVNFIVKLTKNREIDFPQIEMEYCIAWEEENYDSSKTFKKGQTKDTVMTPKYKSGTFVIAPTKEASELITDTVKLTFLDREFNPKLNQSGSGRHLRSKMTGIWIKMYMKTPSGRIVVRDYCNPENLKDECTWEQINK